MAEAEFYTESTLDGVPDVTRIAFRHDGENIAYVDIFPGEGNTGVISNIEFDAEFRAACLHASKVLKHIATEGMNGDS